MDSETHQEANSDIPRTASPTNLPPRLGLKRPNPKRLSLSLTMPTSASPCVTPTFYNPSSTESTPFTPGPPKTPALASGRAARTTRRPSLLSLITQPTDTSDIRGSIRTRSSTAPDISQRFDKPTTHYQTYPNTHGLTFGQSYQSTASSSSPDSSPHTSASGSPSTTPASSPPLPAGFASILYSRPAEPYEDGPIEIIPNVFLGAEDSARDLTWARRYHTLRIVNVAQEVESPYAAPCGSKKTLTTTSTKSGPTVEYCHLRWSHGESGLATIPDGATLEELLSGSADTDAESWGFWNAVKWLEEARRTDTPVLIHCQCGISRSATLAIAYLMSLAVTGQAPSHLGHLKTMQETYDMVKAKSPCIGPNVSLVFQLVEFQRSLTALLSAHVAHSSTPIQTSFPTLAEQTLSEAEWARKRAEFETESEVDSPLIASPLSPEEAGHEARRLDEAMVQRLKLRQESA